MWFMYKILKNNIRESLFRKSQRGMKWRRGRQPGSPSSTAGAFSAEGRVVARLAGREGVRLVVCLLGLLLIANTNAWSGEVVSAAVAIMVAEFLSR